MQKNSKIYVAGHRGLLGSAVVRKLQNDGYFNLILKSSAELDLIQQKPVFCFLEDEKPDYVFVCAAKVGGICANMMAPAEFLYVNLQIQNNIIEGSRRAKVKKLLFVGSSCIYPKEAAAPIKESQLLQGALEPTNEGYALAKIAGIRLCEFYRRQYGCNYLSAIPTNLFGINDNYDLETAHLLPALIHKIHKAKKENNPEITLWGSGRPRREFMLSDDCADVLVFLMQHYEDAAPVNIGLGYDYTVVELAHAVAKVLDARIKINFDADKPDGVMRKLLDTGILEKMGWRSRYSLEEAIEIAYRDFLRRHA